MLFLLVATLLASKCDPLWENAKKACHADYEKFCKGTKGEAAKQCMKQHWKQLSKPCQDAAQNAKSCETCGDLQQAAGKSCQAVAKKMCKGAKSASDYWMCYLDNRSKFAAAAPMCSEDADAAYFCAANNISEDKCGQKLGPRVWKECEAEFKKICPKAKSEADYKKCAQSHWRKFGPACKRSMMGMHKCQECAMGHFAWAYECAEPVNAVCPGWQKMSHDQIAKCIRKNWRSLGQDCQRTSKWIYKACSGRREHPQHVFNKLNAGSARIGGWEPNFERKETSCAV